MDRFVGAPATLQKLSHFLYPSKATQGGDKVDPWPPKTPFGTEQNMIWGFMLALFLFYHLLILFWNPQHHDLL